MNRGYGAKQIIGSQPVWRVIIVTSLCLYGPAHAQDQPPTPPDREIKTQLLERLTRIRTVTLDLGEVTVQEALERLKKEFGWTVEAHADVSGLKILFKTADATFFQSVEHIRRAANLAYEYNAFDHSKSVFPLKLTKASGNIDGHVTTAGPFLMVGQQVAEHVSESNSFGSGKSTFSRQYTTSVALVAEPGVPLAGVEIKKEALETIPPVAAAGDTHVWINSFGGITRPGHSENMWWQFTQCFEVAPKLINFSGRLVLKFSGRLVLKVPVGFKERVIKDLSKWEGKEIKIDGGGLTLQKPSQGAMMTQVSYSATGAAAELWHLSRNRGFGATAAVGGLGELLGLEKKPESREDQPCMDFLDANGRVIGIMGYSSSGGNDAVMGSVKLSGSPVSLRLRWCAKSTSLEFPFVLAAIPVGAPEGNDGGEKTAVPAEAQVAEKAINSQE